jgi:hypothetical protein
MLGCTPGQVDDGKRANRGCNDGLDSAGRLADLRGGDSGTDRPNGDANAGARVREGAEAGKPAHRVWIPTDDKAVQDWARGSRKYLHVEIVAASLGRTALHDYVKGDIVVKLTPAPAATTEPSSR